MAKKKKTTRKTKSIITGHLEKISAKVFVDFSKVITDMIKGHQGIYALYKMDRLYYVGLASNLKNRIKHHLKDRHKGQWTHFSLYIVRKTDHIKEIESVILRISYPKGNAVKGKLTSKDLRPLLKNKLKAEWQKQYMDLLGKTPPPKKKTTAKKKTTTKKKQSTKNNRPLKGIFPTGKVFYATYKGKDYKAWVFGNDRIKYNGQIYDAPSAAGAAVRGGKSTNGWSFWKYKDKNGNLIKLAELRK